MQRADPVLVFDLDGTLLRLNSFPIWLLYLAFGRISHLSTKQRFDVSLQAQRLLLMRKLGRMKHDALLRQLQTLWQSATADDGGATAKRLGSLLLRFKRPNLAPAVKLVTDGAIDGVLATAAAEEYATELSHRLGLTNLLATRSGRDEPQNTGEAKRSRLLAWLQERGWSGRPLIFFNDHMDDLPVMRESSIVCWFGSDRALDLAKQAVPNVRFVACRKLTEREMHATMAHLYQSVTLAQMTSYAA